MHIDTKQSRRAFLARASQLGVAGAAAPLVGSLGAISDAAAAAAPTDYKALVCVFLLGGNDDANTLPPYDAGQYNSYRAARPGIALRRDQLGGTLLRPRNDLGGRQYSLHPSLAPLLPIFNQGKMAPLLNVGALVEPTTRAQYERKAVRLPPQLFSHNDQQSYVQSSAPEGADHGWGGRMGDLYQSSNGTSALTCMSLSGKAIWSTGRNARCYAANSNGVTELFWGGTRLYGSAVGHDALQQLMGSRYDCWLTDEFAAGGKRALDLSSTLASALQRAPAANFTTFTTQGNPLADQLKMIARLISIGPSLGLRRQVFFAAMGGFDSHSNLRYSHPGLLSNVGDALSSFYRATVQMGVANQVTTFTASDFGRTLAENGDGSDHGWGGVQFALGGAVKGGAIYGRPPEIGLTTNDVIRGGRLVPTTSIDQYAATLALWFGVAPGELTFVLPNLANFNPSSWNLNFV